MASTWRRPRVETRNPLDGPATGDAPVRVRDGVQIEFCRPTAQSTPSTAPTGAPNNPGVLPCRRFGRLLLEHVKSSQVKSYTTDNHTEAYRMCSEGQQQWWNRWNVEGEWAEMLTEGFHLDVILVGADLRALGEQVGEKYRPRQV